MPPASTDNLELDPVLSEAFTGKFTHQLRSSITALQGTHFLLSRQMPNLPPSVHKTVGRLLDLQIEAIRNLKHSVDQFLEYTNVDGLSHAQQIQPIALGAFIAKLVQRINAANLPREVGLIDRLERDLVAHLNVNLIELIVESVLSNALKFSPADTPVALTISARRDEWELSVEDRGAGIPPGEESLVFEPFFRGSNVGQIPGAGLGLAIARRATKLCGGSISVAPLNGSGTKILCRFPLRMTTADSLPVPSALVQ